MKKLITMLYSFPAFRGHSRLWPLQGSESGIGNGTLTLLMIPKISRVPLLTVTGGVNLIVVLTVVPLWKAHGCDGQGSTSTEEGSVSAPGQGLTLIGFLTAKVLENAMRHNKITVSWFKAILPGFGTNNYQRLTKVQVFRSD